MVISAPSALAWHEEIIDNREDEQCQQKPVEYRFPFALEKLVCVHFPFALSPRCENELRTAEYSVRLSLPFWRHFPFAFPFAFYGGLDSFRGCVSRQMTLSRRGVVFMKCK